MRRGARAAARLRRVKEGNGRHARRAGPEPSTPVTRLTKRHEVAVLEDPGHGWLKLRVWTGYRTGWLAEWLVTAPNDCKAPRGVADT